MYTLNFQYKTCHSKLQHCISITCQSEYIYARLSSDRQTVLIITFKLCWKVLKNEKKEEAEEEVVG